MIVDLSHSLNIYVQIVVIKENLNGYLASNNTVFQNFVKELKNRDLTEIRTILSVQEKYLRP